MDGHLDEACQKPVELPTTPHGDVDVDHEVEVWKDKAGRPTYGNIHSAAHHRDH